MSPASIREPRGGRPVAEFSLAPSERHAYGATVTCRNQETGEMWTLARTGGAGNAMGEIIAEIDAAGPEWKIASISTPASVFRDLQGSRVTDDGNNKQSRATFEQNVADPRTNERTMLARFKRMDLLEPPRFRVKTKAA